MGAALSEITRLFKKEKGPSFPPYCFCVLF